MKTVCYGNLLLLLLRDFKTILLPSWLILRHMSLQYRCMNSQRQNSAFRDTNTSKVYLYVHCSRSETNVQCYAFCTYSTWVFRQQIFTCLLKNHGTSLYKTTPKWQSWNILKASSKSTLLNVEH